jgi:hypothetical protein
MAEKKENKCRYGSKYQSSDPRDHPRMILLSRGKDGQKGASARKASRPGRTGERKNSRAGSDENDEFSGDFSDVNNL